MKKLLVLLCLLFLAACPTEESVWDTACAMTAGVYGGCENLDAPFIEYFERTGSGYWGSYAGGDTIYIRDDLSGWKKKAVIFHEMIHYLQVSKGTLTLPGPYKMICKAEADAYMITDIYVEYVLGVKGEARYPYWWKPYPYCWRYYAPSGSQMFILSIPGEEIIFILI